MKRTVDNVEYTRINDHQIKLTITVTQDFAETPGTWFRGLNKAVYVKEYMATTWEEALSFVRDEEQGIPES